MESNELPRALGLTPSSYMIKEISSSFLGRPYGGIIGKNSVEDSLETFLGSTRQAITLL